MLTHIKKKKRKRKLPKGRSKFIDLRKLEAGKEKKTTTKK